MILFVVLPVLVVALVVVVVVVDEGLSFHSTSTRPSTVVVVGYLSCQKMITTTSRIDDIPSDSTIVVNNSLYYLC